MLKDPATAASAAKAREHPIAFVEEMVTGMAHVRQRANALLYVRGLIEHGGRKSLQPTLVRLGEDAARYESVQQFLADSPWDADLLLRACAERVAPELDLSAWVVDDAGIVKDGSHSPGVKRQYSGTLGKIGSCQITVSLHAVGERGTVPLGFSLYLPEEWCADPARRRKAKIPDEVPFHTKPELAAMLAQRAAGLEISAATERLSEAGAVTSVGSRGDSYDNALAESVIGLFKTEVIRKRGPWKNLDAAEFATLEWVDCFSHRQLLEPLGYVPPAQFEEEYYRQTAQDEETALKPLSLQ